MSTRQSPAPDGEEASKDELLALTKRMREVADATYWLFFNARMGSDVHAFIEFCGVLAKYVDICERSAQRGVDFRFLNTHSGDALPVEAHDMEYLGEKLDCILGPAIQSNPAAREALRRALFGAEKPARPDVWCVATEEAPPVDQSETRALRRKLALARLALMQVSSSLLDLAPMPTRAELVQLLLEIDEP